MTRYATSDLSRVEVPEAEARRNLINFPPQANAQAFRGRGWWPITGEVPSYDPDAEVLTGPSYEADSETETVTRVWAVRDKTEQELADDLQVRRAGMVVSPFQARAALLASGLLGTVEAAVENYDGEDAEFVKLAWARANEWKRLSPTVLALAAIVGLTDGQLDALFIAAAQIEA